METIGHQLELFGRDDAADLAAACLNLGWGIIERRHHLTPAGAATLKMDLAWLREEVYRVTRPVLLGWAEHDRIHGNAGSNRWRCA